MSTEPDRIYLHDPHGCFDEDTEAGDNNTVTWSEERIDENDYEYIRSAVLGDVSGGIHNKFKDGKNVKFRTSIRAIKTWIKGGKRRMEWERYVFV